MFQFKTAIIKRRRMSKLAILVGLVALTAIILLFNDFINLGTIPALDRLAAQLGLGIPIHGVYLLSFAILTLMTLPAFRTIFKKKVIIGGQFEFDEEHLKIKDGRSKYLIPEKQLQEVFFELQALPDRDKKPPKKKKSSLMKIPTTKGIYSCEFELESNEQKQELLNLAEFLKIEHDVKVEVKEL